MRENCIEWISGDDEISVTFSQLKYINKVKKLAEKYPDLVEIKAENSDGSIFAKLPLKSLKLNIIPHREMDEEHKRKLLDGLRKRG